MLILYSVLQFQYYLLSSCLTQLCSVFFLKCLLLDFPWTVSISCAKFLRRLVSEANACS